MYRLWKFFKHIVEIISIIAIVTIGISSGMSIQERLDHVAHRGIFLPPVIQEQNI